MPRTRQAWKRERKQEWGREWERVALIELTEGKPHRPVSILGRTLAPQTIVPAHSHNWGQLIYAYRGVLDISTPEGRYRVPPHRAVWVPPDIPHEVASPQGAEISSVYITTEESESLSDNCEVIEVSALLRELILEAARQPEDYLWEGKTGRLFRTLRDQVAAANPVPLYLPLPRDPRLLSIFSQLQARPDLPHTLSQWGDRVGASGRTLQRLIQKETGMSFQRWRQQIRIQIALERLVTGNDSITKIAGDCGYESSSAFISMFQQQLGMTPGEYAKTLTGRV